MPSEVSIQIRWFESNDVEQIARLFHDTIRTINYPDYTLEQVRAWAPDDIFFRDWLAACSSKLTLVAENNEQILGFAQLETNGHIDCFYCHHNFQRQGVGKALYNALELQARRWELPKLHAEVSITAKPFFLGLGFITDRPQMVEVRGIRLKNYVMYKNLSPNDRSVT